MVKVHARRVVGVVGSCCLLCGSALAQRGPDLIVADLYNTNHYGMFNGIRAYSVGTVSCNIGDMDARWERNNNNHPVIAQNLYRLKNGRIEQLGLSWLKHGFTTVDSGICGQCPPNGTGDHLSPGCSDPYSASLNGDRNRLGPRYEVNPSTGVFPYPYDNSGPIDSLLSRRIQVPDADMDPNQNAGALYFVEGHYVAKDDATWGNNDNNMSYRRITVNADRSLTLRDTTQRQIPAIKAWYDHGRGANMPDPSVVLTTVDVPGDGLFWLAAKATDNGDGTWHYEYAIQNISSDRAGGSFTVPFPRGARVTGTGFHDVNYHSGEPWLPDDFVITVGLDNVTWTSPRPYDQEPRANALRWATLYNFWFDIDAEPTTGDVTLGLFKPGTPASVNATLIVPKDSGDAQPGDMNCDGAVDSADIEGFILALFDPDAYANQYPNCDINNADVNGDGLINSGDIEGFVNLLFGP